MIPKNWNEFLNAHVFIINLDRKPERLQKSTNRIKNAGFTNINRFKAIDGIKDDMESIWKDLGSPEFNFEDQKFIDKKNHPHHQAICLSHILIYKEIIEKSIPWSVIFEDDIVFHKDWNILAPKFFEVMPKDYDMCFIGHHCGNSFDGQVGTVPVYCLHAYGITYTAAKYLYNKFINHYNKIFTIDCMIYNLMCANLMNDIYFLKWYVWNSESFPDETAKKHQEHKNKDMGLVFQEYDGNKYDDYK